MSFIDRVRPTPLYANLLKIQFGRDLASPTLEIRRIHDGTLERFVADRSASGVTATTINRSLEVARTILNRAARSYRDSDGRPWLEGMPPLITMLPEAPRPPYPITGDEQDRLFSKLPARLARMVLFAVNTGLRESNVCGLEWTWEVAVSEVGRSVFVIPPEAFKSRRAHLVVLNDAAWSIVQAQRGRDPIWVFPYRGRHVSTVNNTAWQRARREAGLRWGHRHRPAPRGEFVILPLLTLWRPIG